MIAKKSDLILNNFAVIDSNFSFVPKEVKKNINPQAILNKYPVNIDFELQQYDDSEIFRIIVDIKINNSDDAEIGYSIAVTGLGFFSFDKKSELNDEQKSQLLQTSGLSICITNLRAYIVNQTSYFPWGSYSFHSVDIQQLLLEKDKSIK